MKNLGLLFTFLLVITHLEAQIQPTVRMPSLAAEAATMKLQMSATIALTDFSAQVASDKLLNYPLIKGTPYAKEESSIGYFYLGDSVIKTPTRLNYYCSSFEFVADGKTYIATANTIDSVIVDNETYVYRFIKVKGKDLSQVVKVINRQGKNKIYVYKAAEFKQEVKPGPLVDYKPAHFEWIDPIYLFEIENKLIPLNNFKGVMEAFPGKEKDIKKFIKDNRINNNNPLELKMLLGFVSHL